MKSPIHSVKHIVNLTPTTAASGTIAIVNFAVAVVSPDANTSIEVVEGSVIKAVYLEFWFTGDDAVQGSMHGYFEKVPSGAPNMTFTQAANMTGYPNKNNVFISAQGLTPPNIQAGIPFFRGWIKIPKGKQRFALGDKLNLNWTGITDGTVCCGLVIYKEYR